MKILYKEELVKELYALIENSNEFLYIVSPYLNLWEGMYSKLRDLYNKNIKITIFTRDDKQKREFWDAVDNLKNLEIKIYSVQRLHAKIFLNENKAIIGSINMTEYAFSESEEIGGITDTDEEYKMVSEILEDRIKPIINTPEGVLQQLKEKFNNTVKDIYIKDESVFLEHNAYKLRIYMDHVRKFQDGYDICIDLEPKEKKDLVYKNKSKIKNDVFDLFFAIDRRVMWHPIPLSFNKISSLLEDNSYEFRKLVERLVPSIEKILN
jgi:phosphatidylserine/phosphatidylglycerophosphate/cardiolipin synthase-like enzyme